MVPRDADGNAIVTDQYESATGTHVKITLGSSGNPSFRFSPNNFSSAAKGLAVTVNYKPSGVTGAQVQNGFSTVLTATANNGATVGSATFAALAPHVTEFTTPTAASEPIHDHAGQRRCDLVHGDQCRQDRADSDQCDQRYADYRVCDPDGRRSAVWHHERPGRPDVVYGAGRQ